MFQPTVTDVLLDVLASANARHMFGMPGDAINTLIESVRTQSTIKFVQVRHEEAGAFAASAQAKLTGELGVCVGTAGPGAIHLLNGLYDAKMDHAPVLAITGQVSTAHLGTEYHQEVDSKALFADVSVFNETVTSPEQITDLAVLACRAALAHRGVAHLAIAEDVAGQSVSNAGRLQPVSSPSAQMVPCQSEIDKAVELIDKAERVVILAGIGAGEGVDELFALADAIAAPIVTTLRAKDVIPDEHPLCIGGIGQLGGLPGVRAVENCDLLLMVGTDFPYHDFYPDNGKTIQIDRDPTRIGRRHPVDLGLVGNALPTLVALRESVQVNSDKAFLGKAQGERKDWFDDMAESEQSIDSPIKPQMLAKAISNLAREDAVFITDTGAVTVWAARHLRVKDTQRFTLSSALGSMGFGLPGALGAQLAYPERQVIALAGDGGFAMLMADLVTAVKYDLPVKIVVFNNAKLGLIKMEQEGAGFPEHQTDLLNADFAAYARACGAHGYTVSEASDVQSVLSDAFAADGPAVVDVRVDGDEITMPPRIGAKDAMNYGLAKAKEMLS